jgi:exonuclease VII large subunit
MSYTTSESDQVKQQLFNQTSEVCVVGNISNFKNPEYFGFNSLKIKNENTNSEIVVENWKKNLSNDSDKEDIKNSNPKILQRTHKLDKIIENELKKYKNYISSDYQEALQKIENAKKIIVNINYLDILVELSPTNAIIFKILLKKGVFLFITLPFGEVIDLEENEVVYSLFENRNLIVSNAKLLPEIIQGAVEYIKQA